MYRNLLLLLVVVTVFLCTSELQAAKPEKNGPSIIKLKMGKNVFELDHRKHQQLTGDNCWECHNSKKGVGKIDNWSEATAHKVCIPCHDLHQKGPISCKGCHKK